LPEKLKEQIKFINKPDIAIVFSNYEKINEAGKRAAREIIAPPLVDYYQLLKGNCIGCLTVLYDTDKVGKMYFKNVRHEDCVLWLSILKKGYKAQNTNTVTALYRVGSHSISSNKVKLLLWQWNILRKEEELSFYKAFYYYIHYAIRAFLKSLK
jgi:teichuronic acid biosynthesis glycosyltransferase TuaG